MGCCKRGKCIDWSTRRWKWQYDVYERGSKDDWIVMLGSPAMDARISELCGQLSDKKFAKCMMWERNTAG